MKYVAALACFVLSACNRPQVGDCYAMGNQGLRVTQIGKYSAVLEYCNQPGHLVAYNLDDLNNFTRVDCVFSCEKRK